MSDLGPLNPALLPAGVRSRFLNGINGLRLHVLEAGFEAPGRPGMLLLHGFPELAYSWRRVMPALAAAGYHVVAPDQRGYGRSNGWPDGYDIDLAPFHMLNLVRDAQALVRALGWPAVQAVVGHDFGAPVAAWCALSAPQMFRSLVLMSAPFGGPPASALMDPASPYAGAARLDAELRTLAPARQHYQWYFGGPQADAHMWHSAQGVHDFLRAYFHHKSADWPGNQPLRLANAGAAELARMPTYYVMDRDQTMAQTVATQMPDAQAIAGCTWLPDDELRVFSGEYQRTGFQGGLQWYRCTIHPGCVAERQRYSGQRIEVPVMFIAGASDWGVYQRPGDYERMATNACTQWRGSHLISGAGHWVQQEQPQEVVRLLLGFLNGVRS